MAAFAAASFGIRAALQNPAYRFPGAKKRVRDMAAGPLLHFG